MLQSAAEHDRVHHERGQRAEGKAPSGEPGPKQRARGVTAASSDAPAAAPRAPGGTTAAAGSTAASRRPESATEGSGDSGSSGSGADRTRAAAAVSCADDMSGDTEGSGSTPAYTDLTRACVREQGSQLVLQATTAGAPPARMPDGGTNLAMGFELGRDVYVGIQSTGGGWSAYLTHGNGRRALAPPRVVGREVQVVVPVAALDGARQVAWRMQSSWTRSTLVSTAYAFDEAPNGHASSFERG